MSMTMHHQTSVIHAVQAISRTLIEIVVDRCDYGVMIHMTYQIIKIMTISMTISTLLTIHFIRRKNQNMVLTASFELSKLITMMEFAV